MKKFFLILLVFFIFLAVLAFSLVYTFKNINHSNSGKAHIFEGATSKQIADILESEGVVDDADYFYLYIKGSIWYHKHIKKDFKEKDYMFRQGDYKFKKGDFSSVIKLLAKGENDPQYVSVTFPEGITIKEIASILENKKAIKAERFLTYVRNQQNYLQFKRKYPWLPTIRKGIKEPFEGYLHTTTYSLPKSKPFETDASIIVDNMLKETNRWYVNNLTNIESQSYSFSQLITLASIVEREAKFNVDRPVIAQVFYNRLNKGMKLQSDMTAAYALGRHKVFMYNKDINVKSLYNTYYVKGLPIGPISAPSEASFRSVINPAANSNYLFFYARPSGETKFATTIKEHQHNINLYEKEWKALEKKQKSKTK